LILELIYAQFQSLEDLIKHEVHFKSMFQSLGWIIFEMVSNGFELELQLHLVNVWIGLEFDLDMAMV
jgi:hypothetical protein